MVPRPLRMALRMHRAHTRAQRPGGLTRLASMSKCILSVDTHNAVINHNGSLAAQTLGWHSYSVVEQHCISVNPSSTVAIMHHFC